MAKLLWQCFGGNPATLERNRRIFLSSKKLGFHFYTFKKAMMGPIGKQRQNPAGSRLPNEDALQSTVLAQGHSFQLFYTKQFQCCSVGVDFRMREKLQYCDKQQKIVDNTCIRQVRSLSELQEFRDHSMKKGKNNLFSLWMMLPRDKQIPSRSLTLHPTCAISQELH